MPPAPLKPLRRWIWRAFLQSALIPLVLVESVLIGVYLYTNESIRESQVGYLQSSALQDLDSAVRREGQVIDSRLRAIEAQVGVYRDAVAEALGDNRYEPDEQERERHASTPEGVYYSRSDDSRAASFYSSSTKSQDRDKALRLSRVDPLMRSIRQADPLVAAVYFNSWDSYNRIYPYFDVLQQYPHDMVIPQYNFYYLADGEHNPARGTVWTEVYLDPAGQGWMMSAIAPVYRDNFLEGVAGLDVTVGQMLNEIGNLQVPWQGYALLVGGDNAIMALPAAGEKDFGLRELTSYSYAEAVRREVLKPADFKLNRQAGLQPLLEGMAAKRHGVVEVQLGGRGQLMAWSEIPQTGWRLLLVVDEANIFSETNRLAAQYQTIGYLLIAGLAFFYLLFGTWMWLRSRRLSNELAEPMAGIVGMMRSLGVGERKPVPPPTVIAEMAEMATEVQHAGQQLQASEESRQHVQRTLELVLESTTESLWEVDAHDLCIRISERFVRRFGLPGECMPFAEFNQRVHPDDLPRIRHLRLSMADDSVEDFFEAEYRYADAQGRYVWLLSRGKVIERDERGRAVRGAGTHVDITRLKQVQEELRRASLDAQAASQAKSRFLSSMSHELRTPLNAIHGFAQLIELETQERAERDQEAEYAREIVHASRHLTALVDDILDLSSIESRQQQLQLQPVDIGPLLRGCAELIQPEVQQRRLQLQLQAEAHPPLFVLADPRRLRQVVLNLLSNAVKYNSPQGMIRLGYEVRAGGVRLSVDDTGPGLSPEQQAQLFQPFQRLGRENSNIPGTGIGLVLCRELAELMGGEMGFSSDVGLGSRFWIELPSAAAPASAERTDAAGVIAVPEALAQVLCVEDHPACLRVLQEGLRGIAEVAGAGSVRRALLLLSEQVPALVLLDLDLPDGSGLEILDAMRADPRLAEVPVLVVSAASDEDVLDEARAKGAQACLLKPVDLQQLRQIAVSLLSEVA
ncbi:hybrid sensor histidine kinase/response regulator [Pseudomonas sp. Gutcm_11s]|uniref:hybrid sensor histidine kinase/response regulator n=1 Tax=Pseudomonas sp. Gutcm_11s TaxID=3026088 RepID=UPI0023604A9C|nr:ATP-binding protein [Pseudomonas sp. Gutcm_11s]MDD0844629.1 ATP-binding protein [Pseudomonas sp. Gutcm_11s]